MAAKSLAVTIEFAISICLMLLMKQIAMYVESFDEVFGVILYILDSQIYFEGKFRLIFCNFY